MNIVLGSANFNERSTAGDRDTELALSACELGDDGHVMTNGAIKEFRRRLWAEHTSGLSEKEEALADPASLCAIQRVEQLADEAF